MVLLSNASEASIEEAGLTSSSRTSQGLPVATPSRARDLMTTLNSCWPTADTPTESRKEPKDDTSSSKSGDASILVEVGMAGDGC